MAEVVNTMAKMTLLSGLSQATINTLSQVLSPEQLEELKRKNAEYMSALLAKKEKRDWAIQQAKIVILKSSLTPEEIIVIMDELEAVKDTKDYWGILFSNFSIGTIITYVILALMYFMK